MPGHGGGGHSGGFGGGSHGGGFGGGHGGPGGGHYYGGGFHRGPGGRGMMYHGYPMFHYWGHPHTGCLGGLIGFIIGPIISIVVALALISFGCLAMFGGGTKLGMQIVYDESTFEDYANDQYFEIFGNLYDTEDEILLVFLVDDDYTGYYTIAWVGDDIAAQVNVMFGDETTTYGKAITDNIGDNFKYNLERDLASAIDTMTEAVKALGVERYFRTKDCTGQYEIEPVVINNTEANSSQNLKTAMAAFTAETGIPMAVVIENENVVLESKLSETTIFLIGFGLVALIIGIVPLVQLIKSRAEYNRLSEDEKERIRRESDYKSGYDSYYDNNDF